MATDRTRFGLGIALIIFVMITFILSVTTYIGFQQRTDAQKAAKTFDDQMKAANREKDAAVQEADRIRAVIGPEKASAADIEAQLTDLYDRRFTDLKQEEPKTLLRLIDAIGEGLKAKDDELARRKDEQTKMEEVHAKAVADAVKAKDDAEAAREDALAKLAQAEKKFEAAWKEHEQNLAKMRKAQDDALAKVSQLEAIGNEITKLRDELTAEQQQQHQGDPLPSDKLIPFLTVVRDELRTRQTAVRNLNVTLAKLRVADPKLQEIVRKSTPEDQRIDGFDGRIASVNAVDRTVLIVCESTGAMRPGLVLAVYDPDDPRPQIGTRKGLVEVVEVESPTLARARIIRDSAAAPIVAGDGTATSLWAADADREIVIVGFVRFGSGRKQDAAALAALVERQGARVVDKVTAQTALVVDAGLPGPGDSRAGLGKEWRPVDETIRKNALKRAEELGIRVSSLDGLLDMLGVDREILDGQRLPNELGAAP